MKFVAISDTHNRHAALKLPAGDVLLHAGDITFNGLEREVHDFLQWFKNQDFRYKIFTAGNHDFFFEREPAHRVHAVLPGNVQYLQDSGVSIEGLKVWGSPITPWFFNWAFNRHRGAEIRKHWNMIPEDTDVIITHGPPLGVLDQNRKGEHLGCRDLSDRLKQVKPKVHVFGHIHEGYGTRVESNVKYINCSVMDEEYQLVNPPVAFKLGKDK